MEAPFKWALHLERRRHFIGETPRRTITLSPFSMASIPVTNTAIFGLLDRRRLQFSGEDLQKHAVKRHLVRGYSFCALDGLPLAKRNANGSLHVDRVPRGNGPAREKYF